MNEAKPLSAQSQAKLVQFLAEMVAWNGSEDHLAACDRLLAAERFLRRVAPAALKAEKEKVKAANDRE